jgi:hypothetical protein
MVWEATHVLFSMADDKGLPAPAPWHLLIARNVLNPQKIKYFMGDAPPKTPVGTLLRVGFSRWPLERAFEDQKSELGLDHYEGRRYPGLKRHLVLSAISHRFLSRVRLAEGEKDAELTVSQIHTAIQTLILFWWLKLRVPAKLIAQLAKDLQATQADNAKARQAHIKNTRRKLRALGIRLTDVERCTWDTS